MTFPFFPESHPAMTVENFTYMRQLHQQQQHQKQPQKLTEGWGSGKSMKQLRSQSPPNQKGSSPQQTTIDLGAGQADRRPPLKRGLGRMLIPARLRKIKSVEDSIISSASTSKGHDPSSNVSSKSPHAVTIHNDIGIASSSPCTSSTSYQEISSSNTGRFFPPRYSPSFQLPPPSDPYLSTGMLRSCSRLLTNPFSQHFELNPMLLNIPHPLLSRGRQRRRHLRVLDLGGNEDSVYTRAINALPRIAVCQVPQRQLEGRIHTLPSLPFQENSFDVVSTRTLYRFISAIHQTSMLDQPCSNERILGSWVREIYRLLDKRGSFEYIFFDRRLSHAGPLARALEPFFYEETQFSFCDHPQNQQSEITGRDNCTLCQNTATTEPVTAARFLELLANQGFTIEKNMTLMFPISLLSTFFTQDGQRVREDRGISELDELETAPALVSLMEKIHEECRVSQTAWKCIIGCAVKT